MVELINILYYNSSLVQVVAHVSPSLDSVTILLYFSRCCDMSRCHSVSQCLLSWPNRQCQCLCICRRICKSLWYYFFFFYTIENNTQIEPKFLTKTVSLVYYHIYPSNKHSVFFTSIKYFFFQPQKWPHLQMRSVTKDTHWQSMGIFLSTLCHHTFPQNLSKSVWFLPLCI